MPVSGLALAVLMTDDRIIDYRHCATYLHAIQRMGWFKAAFPAYADPVTVVGGRGSSRGHHHAWRANFVLIVRKTLGKQAALRLRHEFDQWGLPTRK